MTLKRGFKQLIADAEAEIKTITVANAGTLLNDERYVIVDLRDIRELWREGKIPGAVHAPRGMLEFWVDPDSPYHRSVFGTGKKLIFYCQSGWRSALATKAVQDMGLTHVAHIGGGFVAWRDAERDIEIVEPQSPITVTKN